MANLSLHRTRWLVWLVCFIVSFSVHAGADTYEDRVRIALTDAIRRPAASEGDSHE